MDDKRSAPPRVVIVGGGFGGLFAAKAFDGMSVRVTLVDKTNHHVFQPLLYQVATAGLSPAEIAQPIRSILRGQENVTVLLDEVLSVNLADKSLVLKEEGTLRCDYLILATGARNNYFGHDEWEQHAPGLKSLDEALEIRRRVLLAFEAAEREPDVTERARLLTFVVIGGGPTGVEMAGAISELSRFALARDFRAINPTHTRVVLVEAGPRILGSFDDTLCAKAMRQLGELGVDVRTGAKVMRIDGRGVYFEQGDVPSATVVWAAGVQGSALAKTLGAELDRSGRVVVEKDSSIPGHPEAFAIGDMCAMVDAKGVKVPGLSQPAMQEARLVARNIAHSMRGEAREQFVYFDKGTMATIGRSRAIADAFGIKMSGFIAWLAWLGVHLWYLIGFRNRLIVMISWMWSYLTFRRGARLITGGALEAGAPHVEIGRPRRSIEPPEPRATDRPDAAAE